MSDELNPTPDAPAAPAAEPEGGSPERTFTADELSKVVEERLARQKRSLASKLGVESLDEVTAIIEEHRQLKTERMSEVERAQAAAEEAARKAQALEAELTERKRIDSQRALLAEMGFDAAAIEKLAGRLAGEDAEAWKADAEGFLTMKASKTPATPPQAANDLDLPSNPMQGYQEAMERGDIAAAVAIKNRVYQS